MDFILISCFQLCISCYFYIIECSLIYLSIQIELVVLKQYIICYSEVRVQEVGPIKLTIPVKNSITNISGLTWKTNKKKDGVVRYPIKLLIEEALDQ